MDTLDARPDPMVIPHDELLTMIERMAGPVSNLRIGARDQRGMFPWTGTARRTGEPLHGTFTLNFAPADPGIKMTILATVDRA